jgi:hypothetical protein
MVLLLSRGVSRMRVDSKQSRRIRLGNEHTCIYDLLNKRI